MDYSATLSVRRASGEPVTTIDFSFADPGPTHDARPGHEVSPAAPAAHADIIRTLERVGAFLQGCINADLANAARTEP